MMMVSWYGANAYSLWANRRDWRAYRGTPDAVPSLRAIAQVVPPPAETMCSCLPSEAQWEYAARGPTPRRFPWGDEPAAERLARVGVHAPGDRYAGADAIPAADVNVPLGLSPFGLHHMAGNVWQWCRDWYAPAFGATPASSRPDPQNDVPTGVRSERGGSWVGPAELARCAYRRGRPPEARGRCLGFRCVGVSADVPADV